MSEAINWKDEACSLKYRTILTNQQIQVPGIRIFATLHLQNALFPLLPHYHEDAFEFTFIVKGSMYFFANNNQYEVPGGSVFVSFPNEIHSTNNIPIPVHEQYWIQVDITDPDHFLFLKREQAEELIANLKKISRHIITADASMLGTIIERAFKVAKQNDNPLLLASYLSVFLQLVIEASKEHRYHHAPDIEYAITYISKHLQDELLLDDLAELCDLSTSQFKQKFRRIVGMAPRNYINKKKIEYSKKLLTQNMSITDVAMALNFATSSYFSTVFKKHTTQSPKEYQNNCKKEGVPMS